MLPSAWIPLIQRKCLSSIELANIKAELDEVAAQLKAFKPQVQELGEKLAPLKPLEDDIISTRIFILKDFSEGSYFQANNRLTAGGRILKDIAIIEKESLSGDRRNVKTLKKGFKNLYGLSYRYAGELKEADDKSHREIIEAANIFADFQTVLRSSNRHDLRVLQCWIIFDHWLTWVDQGKKPGEYPFEAASHARNVYNDLIADGRRL